MTGRRKGTPCACECDPCSHPRSVGIRTINNQYPDANHEFSISAGEGVSIDPDDHGIRIAIRLSSPMIFKGTVGSGGTIAALPAASADNLGWTYIAISSGSTPDTPPKSYIVGDMLISNSVEWSVVPSGDDPVEWSQIQNTPSTLAGYGITDAVTLNTIQEILAKKTFKNELIADNEHSIGGNLTANIDIVMQNQQGIVPTDNPHFGALRFLDKTGSYDAGISYSINTSGNKFFSMGWAGDGLGTIDIGRQGANGDIYALAPTRPYNAANTRDIVTIGSLASNPSVMHPTYTHQNITFNTLSGLTITATDNNENSKGFELCGNILIVNLSIKISGTYTGTTGWQTLFDWPAGTNNIRAPYLITVTDYTDGTATRVHQGRYMYFTNGQTYDIRLNTQITCPYNG